MPIKKTMKPLHLFIPITRSQRTDDGSALYVEGYCYVNPVVGDGWNLKRSAMEKATQDYMTWGAVREMHQPSAVGTATGSATVEGKEIPLGVEWNDKGAFLRALVVDANAIEKVERNVYKGFSVGVKPQITHGKDVETCGWIENSLVDRPYDTGATLENFCVARADGITDPNAEFEVDEYADGEALPDITRAEETTETAHETEKAVTLIRGLFAAKIKSRENSRLRGLAWDVLSSAFSSILYDSTVTDLDKAVSESLDEFKAYITPLMVQARQASDAAASAMPDEIYYADGINDDSLITRFAEVTRQELATRAELAEATTERDAIILERSTLTAQRDELVTERDGLLTRVQTAETDLSTAREDITRRLSEITAKDATIAVKEAEIKRLSNMPDSTQATPIRFHGSEREFMANRVADSPKDTEEVENARTEIARLTTELQVEKDEKKRVAGVAQLNRLKGIIANG